MLTNVRMRVGALIALAVSGCSLTDVTNFNLDLPDKKFTIDTMSWSVDPARADAALNTPCASTNQCMVAAESVCAMDCSGTCDAQRCTISLEVGLHTSVDLLMEKPELQQINDKQLIEVEVDDLLYVVAQNTLNVATPELGVYVAPISIMDPTDPLAKQIGTIPAVEPGFTLVTPEKMKFTADGRDNLKAAMGNYKTPFNVIVGASLTIAAGQAVPTGKLDAIIRVRAHAGI